MKLRKDDKVVVITGRNKGKTGAVLAVLPKENKVVVENVNVVKRHTKPSQKQPRGGILEITKPIDASKVMVLDPHSGKPARIGYESKPDGSKERIFKVSPNHDKAAKKSEARRGESEKADKAKKDNKDTKKTATKPTDKSETRRGEAEKK